MAVLNLKLLGKRRKNRIGKNTYKINVEISVWIIKKTYRTGNRKTKNLKTLINLKTDVNFRKIPLSYIFFL